jgi:hypothetical protein
MTGRKRDDRVQASGERALPELVIFPGLNVALLREVVRENKAQKDALKTKQPPAD